MARLLPYHQRLEFWGGVRRHNEKLWDGATINNEQVQLPQGLFNVLSVVRPLEDGGVLRSREADDAAEISDVSLWLPNTNALTMPQEGVVLRIRASLGEQRFLERRQFPGIPATVAEELAMEDVAFMDLDGLAITVMDPGYPNLDERAGQLIMAAFMTSRGELPAA